MNKKHIIIFGTLILLLIIVVGGMTYYQEQKSALEEEYEFVEDKFFHLPTLLEENQSYLIWCRNLYEEYDCSAQKIFNPEEIIGVSVDLAKFSIPFDSPYFFCYETSLEENREGDLNKKCLPFSSSEIGNFLSVSKNEELIFTNNQTITLIKIMIYPNNNFNDDESITAIDLKAQVVL